MIRITRAMRARNPLITQTAAKTLRRMAEHPDAPRWNYVCGDRLTREDVRALDVFRAELAARRGARRPGPPGPGILGALASFLPRVGLFRDRVPRGIDLARDWELVPTTSREDLAASPGAAMPDDCDLDRMVVHTTSGVTGHAILIPHDPRAGSAYKPLIEVALAAHGVRPEFRPDGVGAILLGAQARTVTYATVHAAWNNSGFAKINLRPGDWPRKGSAGRWFEAMAPLLLTGDPVSFAGFLRLRPAVAPLAMLSTAVSLPRELARRLREAYSCPVIDWYSLNETGPVAYACPEGALHVLSHDLFVEAIDDRGRQVPAGTRGEITVSGGRNPFLPLLRYRTGDHARLDYGPCPCGDAMPRLEEFEGRPPVVFRATDGGAVIPVDVSRVLRRFPLVQHRLVQHPDLSCELVARPVPGTRPDTELLRKTLRSLFGAKAKIGVRLDPRLGDRAPGGKVVPYESGCVLE